LGKIPPFLEEKKKKDYRKRGARAWGKLKTDRKKRLPARRGDVAGGGRGRVGLRPEGTGKNILVRKEGGKKNLLEKKKQSRKEGRLSGSSMCKGGAKKKVPILEEREEDHRGMISIGKTIPLSGIKRQKRSG